MKEAAGLSSMPLQVAVLQSVPEVSDDIAVCPLTINSER